MKCKTCRWWMYEDKWVAGRCLKKDKEKTFTITDPNYECDINMWERVKDAST